MYLREHKKLFFHVKLKAMEINHPIVNFNKAQAVLTNCTRHLGMYLDEKLNFNYHIRKKIAKGEKVSKRTAVI